MQGERDWQDQTQIGRWHHQGSDRSKVYTLDQEKLDFSRDVGIKGCGFSLVVGVLRVSKGERIILEAKRKNRLLFAGRDSDRV